MDYFLLLNLIQILAVRYIIKFTLWNFHKNFYYFAEPGYYENGKFGIRIENVMRIVKANTPHNYSNKVYLTFETVTLVPIQTKLLLPDLLTREEVSFIILQCKLKVFYLFYWRYILCIWKFIIIIFKLLISNWRIFYVY